MDDVGAGPPKEMRDAKEIPRPPQPWIDAKRRDRNASRMNFSSDRTELVNRADHRLEPSRKMLDEIERQFFGAAHLECVGDIHHAHPVCAHATGFFQATVNTCRCTSDSKGSIDSTAIETSIAVAPLRIEHEEQDDVQATA